MVLEDNIMQIARCVYIVHKPEKCLLFLSMKEVVVCCNVALTTAFGCIVC